MVGCVYPYLGSHRQEMDDDCIHDDAFYHDSPAVSLLRTCKRICEEAEPLLYKRNTFILPNVSFTTRFFDTSLNTDTRRLWVKTVELDLDPSDMASMDKSVINSSRPGLYKSYQERLSDQPGHSASESNRLCTRDLHKAFKQQLVTETWPAKLAPILKHLLLDKLIVNLECSTCEDGCCELFAGALTAFRNGFVLAVPKIFQTFGLLELDAVGLFDRGEYPEAPETIISTAIKSWSSGHGHHDDVSEPVWETSHSDGWVEEAELEVERVGVWGP